ncbi:competence/damage-inducible protein A [Telmatospirillum siberiense]|uniref:Competence/damage-inducible protein A n=1 Tax=Telmatospirillum siberiense TaxID=382514 RepID=A0A2N3PMN9_9PROT|nr:molybdopterin-binding protein [Telmatospirillum siberiense]PKU21652.1 competence/damage-inducible protein A [Telmatospirillum siberiense]
MVEEVTAALVIIGNEVLSGRTQDANLQYIALGLNEAGVRLKEVRVVADDEAAIIKTVNELRAANTYVFTTGGIGPTHDDITAECIAKAFGVALKRDPRAVECLLRQIKPENLNEARLRMANIPDGGELIDNPVSHAPGFRVDNVFVMAGVPKIMQAMFDGIRGSLKGGAKMVSKSVTIHAGEGVIADGLRQLQERRPDVEIGSYPFNREGRYGTVIVTRGTDPAVVERVSHEVALMAQGLGAGIEEESQPPR